MSCKRKNSVEFESASQASSAYFLVRPPAHDTCAESRNDLASLDKLLVAVGLLLLAVVPSGKLAAGGAEGEEDGQGFGDDDVLLHVNAEANVDVGLVESMIDARKGSKQSSRG